MHPLSELAVLSVVKLRCVVLRRVYASLSFACVRARARVCAHVRACVRVCVRVCACVWVHCTFCACARPQLFLDNLNANVANWKEEEAKAAAAAAPPVETTASESTTGKGEAGHGASRLPPIAGGRTNRVAPDKSSDLRPGTAVRPGTGVRPGTASK